MSRGSRPGQSGSLIAAAFAVLCAACTASDSKGADTHAISPAPTPVASAARFTAADFAHLRWLAGDWRGRQPSGKSFYERYRVIDDSTIRMSSFSDSTFKTQGDSSMIGLRGGRVVDQGQGTAFATRVDSNTVDFASPAAPRNHFTWVRVSKNQWTAQLFNTDSAGTETRIVYPMERMPRK